MSKDNLHCELCGREFKYRPNKRYCIRRCQQLHNNRKRLESSLWRPKTPSSTVGAGHELLVCLDLMYMGYHVFRAQSPTCPCDVILLDRESKESYRVEVRTCERKVDGSLSFSKAKGKREDYFDIYAAVTHDGAVEYFDSNLNPCDIQKLETLRSDSP